MAPDDFNGIAEVPDGDESRNVEEGGLVDLENDREPEGIIGYLSPKEKKILFWVLVALFAIGFLIVIGVNPPSLETYLSLTTSFAIGLATGQIVHRGGVPKKPKKK